MSDNVNSNEGWTEEGEWKFQAPYLYRGDFEIKHEGRCHCGAVRYTLNQDAPLDSKLCHCRDCQIQHGAPYQWAAIFHKDAIKFSHGYHNLEWYHPESKNLKHTLPCKVRCSHCKTPIMDEGRHMILIFPTLIDLSSERVRDAFRPKLHMFYSQRVMDVPDDLPKWSGMPEQSDLIEDNPPEEMKL